MRKNRELFEVKTEERKVERNWEFKNKSKSSKQKESDQLVPGVTPHRGGPMLLVQKQSLGGAHGQGQVDGEMAGGGVGARADGVSTGTSQKTNAKTSTIFQVKQLKKYSKCSNLGNFLKTILI